MGQGNEKQKGYLVGNKTEDNQRKDNFVQINGRLFFNIGSVLVKREDTWEMGTKNPIEDKS